MTSIPPKPGQKALAYAEDTLEVHKIWHEARMARNKLDDTLTALSETRDKKRDLEMRLVDAEMLVASDETAKHPDMAIGRMEQHLKVAKNNNDACRELREQISKTVSDIDGLECDKEVTEADIKIAVARLTELGGYLQYLAVVKITQPTKPTLIEES